jgi:CRP-like cAMP-binding protein
MADESALQLQDALKEFFLFSGLSEEELGELAGRVSVETYDEYTPIVNEGDKADTLYIVLSGLINITKSDGMFLSMLGPGGFFGEMALFLQGSRRSASCHAAAPTRCALLNARVLNDFCENRPKAGLRIYRAIISTLSERLQATSADLAVLMTAKRVVRQDDVDKIVAQAMKKRDQEK